MAQQYIGVYATKERAPAMGDASRSQGSRKRLWFAWEMTDGSYKVQVMNAAHQPMAEPRIITAKEFSARFSYEADCFFAPEGYTHPSMQGMDAASDSLPDLFPGDLGNSSDASSASPETRGGIQANDPNLLLVWARAEPKVKAQGVDPAKIPFDRLVGDMSQEDGSETAANVVPADEPARTPVVENKEEAQHVRQLRSRFVQALLLLRRGARAESLALLEEMLTQQYDPFEGGAQLFSEFGLGLRRLGFVQLALIAHKRALDFAPRDERILFNIARSYHDLDLLPEAKDYLEKALAVAPDFAAARQFLMFIDINEPRKKPA